MFWPLIKKKFNLVAKVSACGGEFVLITDRVVVGGIIFAFSFYIASSKITILSRKTILSESKQYISDSNFQLCVK